MMRKKFPSLMATVLCIALLTNAVDANDNASLCVDDAILVFDGSGSMAAMGHNGLDHPRIFDARSALHRTLPPIAKTRRMGLVVYGPGTENSCSNVDLKFPPRENAAPRILSEIDNLEPSGETPLTRAVQKAFEVLTENNKSGIIVLVTDGEENCGGQVCRMAAQLAFDAPNIVVHVIGFKVRSSFFNWQENDDAGYESGRTAARCLAHRTGGKYTSTESTEELVRALQEALACPLVGLNDPKLMNVLQ